MMRSARGIPSRVSALDGAPFQCVASSRPPWYSIGHCLPSPLPQTALRSGVGIASVLAAAGGVHRAAVRGLLAVGLTSLTVNLPAKFIARRRRPPLHVVPKQRQLTHSPSSGSFPSGHSASAFAFAAGAFLELSGLPCPLGRLCFFLA
jgi:membrane-associated phospholipid phosphatase